MQKICDKCGKNEAEISYTETVNGKTRKMDLCESCGKEIIDERELFLDSFFNLNPFREVDVMFDNMFTNLGLEKPKTTTPRQTQIQPQAPKLQVKKVPKTVVKPTTKQLENPKEKILLKLKDEVDSLKREEGIAVMLQDYSKAAQIKKKREKLQKEAEKIINS